MSKKTPAQLAESVRREVLRMGGSRKDADNKAIEVYEVEKARQGK